MIHAYADDSATDTHAIYAGVVLPDYQCPLAIEYLGDFKRALSVPVEAELHCHELFHTSSRTESDWRHVDLEAAEIEILNLCRRLRQISRDPVSTMMPITGPTAPRLGSDHPLVSDTKGVATLGYMALHQQLIDRFGVDGVRLWLDIDTSRIRWGDGRRQAHLTREFFTALADRATPVLAHPEREPPEHGELLQVADLYAYSLAKRGAGRRATFFAEVCNIAGLKPPSGIFAAEPAWVPADAPNELGQVMWRLQKRGETAVCRFEPMGEGFVWVDILNGPDRVMREQRICEHPNDIGPAIEEFRRIYTDDGWS